MFSYSIYPQTTCTSCGLVTNVHPAGDECHSCGHGYMRPSPKEEREIYEALYLSNQKSWVYEDQDQETI